MKNLFLITLVLIFSVTVFNGCSKYEDGPAFSLKSKKARLEGEWEFEKITDLKTGKEIKPDDLFSGSDASSDSTDMYLDLIGDIDYTFKFEKDGTFGVKVVVMGFSVTQSGTWEFVGDDGLNLSISMSDYMTGEASTTTLECKILRLASKELWLTSVDGSDEYEIRMIPKQ